MSYDIINYDPSDRDAVTGLGDGHGKPNFPPNYKAGQANADWSTDLISDPAGPSADPNRGWESPGIRISEE